MLALLPYVQLSQVKRFQLVILSELYVHLDNLLVNIVLCL